MILETMVGVALGIIAARASEQAYWAWRARRMRVAHGPDVFPGIGMPADYVDHPQNGPLAGLPADPQAERAMVDQLVRIAKAVLAGIDGEDWKHQ